MWLRWGEFWRVCSNSAFQVIISPHILCRESLWSLEKAETLGTACLWTSILSESCFDLLLYSESQSALKLIDNAWRLQHKEKASITSGYITQRWQLEYVCQSWGSQNSWSSAYAKLFSAEACLIMSRRIWFTWLLVTSLLFHSKPRELFPSPETSPCPTRARTCSIADSSKMRTLVWARFPFRTSSWSLAGSRRKSILLSSQRKHLYSWREKTALNIRSVRQRL